MVRPCCSLDIAKADLQFNGSASQTDGSFSGFTPSLLWCCDYIAVLIFTLTLTFYCFGISSRLFTLPVGQDLLCNSRCIWHSMLLACFAINCSSVGCFYCSSWFFNEPTLSKPKRSDIVLEASRSY